MNRQLVKTVTTCVAFAVLQASSSRSALGSTVQDPVRAETPPRPEVSADHSKPRQAARVYLDQAKSMLDAVPEAGLDRDAKKQVSTLREEFSALSDAYGAHAKADREDARATINGNVTGAVDWHARFSDVERRLAQILGAGSSFSPSYAAAKTSAAGPVAGAAMVPPTQSKAASSPASATLVAPATTPATTVVSPAPVGEVAPPAAANAAAAAANTPPGSPTVPVMAPVGTGVTPVTNNGTGTGVTPVTNIGAGTGSGATAALATAGGTVSGATGAGAAAAAGVLISTIGLKNLDLAVRMQLEQFRTSVELFFDATTRLGA